MSDAPPRKLRMGVLVNPIAGLGGRAGLKGSDDAASLAPVLAARSWDEEVPAFLRGAQAVRHLDGKRIVVVTPPGVLGEDVVKAATKFGGPVFEIARIPGWQKGFGETQAEDTVRFVGRLLRAQIDLLVFVGGDGTAVDVARAAGPHVPLLGVPAGVKMFSPVFAQTPEMAAFIANQLAPGFATRSVDVLDLDEASYRSGSWIVRRHTVALTPDAEGVQAGKGAAAATEKEALADLVAWFRDHQRSGVTYLLAAGTTVGALKQELGGGSPFGVDVWRDGSWVALDADEEGLLAALGDEGPAEIIVSPTGTQGALLGRGTAQIGPAVVERVGVENVVVVATPGKLLGLRHLFVDTGDAELDRQFPDYVKVRTDPFTEKMFALHRGPTFGRG